MKHISFETVGVMFMSRGLVNWALTPLVLPIFLLRHGSRIFLKYLWKEDGYDSSRVRLFVAVIWGIWTHRNGIVFRNEDPCPLTIMNIANHCLKEACIVDKKRSLVLKPCNTTFDLQDLNGRQRVIWLSGQEGSAMHILLVDGAWKRNSRSGSERVRALTSLQVEATTVLTGLRSVKEKGIRRVEVKTDCMELLNAILNFPACQFEIVSICSDIFCVARDFDSCCIRKSSRSDVKRAHDLFIRARGTGH